MVILDILGIYLIILGAILLIIGVNLLKDARKEHIKYAEINESKERKSTE